MTQSLLPESTEPLHQRWTLWFRFPVRLDHWQLCDIGDRATVEQSADRTAETYSTIEMIIMPPLERPLMPGKLCHRKRG